METDSDAAVLSPVFNQSPQWIDQAHAVGRLHAGPLQGPVITDGSSYAPSNPAPPRAFMPECLTGGVDCLLAGVKVVDNAAENLPKIAIDSAGHHPQGKR